MSELWEDVKGFEVWELQVHEEQVREGALTDESMLTGILGQKWVHESSLMSRGQKKGVPEDLPDKLSAPAALAMSGERRFAPRLGRKGSFERVEPSCYGDVLLKIGGETVQLFTDTVSKRDRVSFVFKTQVQRVGEAYSVLNSEDE